MRTLGHLLLPIFIVGVSACSKDSGQAPSPVTPVPPITEMDPKPNEAEALPMTGNAGKLDVIEHSAVSAAIPETAKPAPRELTVTIAPRSKAKLTGSVKLVEKAGAVEVTVTVSGVGKAGKRGLHLHEKADCSAPDATSAGEHWNPSGHQHGMPADPMHHLGDLGNIDIKDDGSGELKITVAGATLSDGPNSLIGRAVVLHAKPDDGKTQPAGGSGDRVGCAEIK
jgi:Cu-Zn family superoxide dismutase